MERDEIFKEKNDQEFPEETSNCKKLISKEEKSNHSET